MWASVSNIAVKHVKSKETHVLDPVRTSEAIVLGVPAMKKGQGSGPCPFLIAVYEEFRTLLKSLSDTTPVSED